ncbi:auxin efflux carrier [Favolaschia claudopus]|uniref:Auxin efflux carrier n=1 Tax=Favolaschia claudopus TaxID=2862362 RepID=A0AAW0BWK2_9AGAR
MLSFRAVMSAYSRIGAEAPVEQAGVQGHILSLLLTVFTSIFEVFLLCFAGYVLAWRGILDKRTIKQVNRLNISLFTPSLVFSKVAFLLSPEKLRELWVIPIFFAIVTFVSMTVSFLLSTVFRLQRQQRNFTLAASMFMNSNSLPVALMQSLVVTLPALKQNPDDNPNAMVGRALTYLLLYSTIGMVLRWSVGWHLLTGTESKSNSNPAVVDGEAEETSALIGGNELPGTPRSASQKAELRPSRRWFPKSPEASREHLALHPIPILPQSSPASELESDEAALLGQDKEGLGLPDTSYGSSIHALSLRAYRFCLSVNSFMTAPLWASLASILVACITPLQLAFVEHMHPVKTALSSAGNCSIPTTLVVLGAYFYVPPSSGDDSAGEKPDMNGPPGAAEMLRPTYPGETKAVIISVVSRMLLTPLLMLPLMALCAQIDRQPFNECALLWFFYTLFSNSY